MLRCWAGSRRREDSLWSPASASLRGGGDCGILLVVSLVLFDSLLISVLSLRGFEYFVFLIQLVFNSSVGSIFLQFKLINYPLFNSF